MAAVRSPEDDLIDIQLGLAPAPADRGNGALNEAAAVVVVSKGPSPNPPGREERSRDRAAEGSPNGAGAQRRVQRRVSSVPMLLPPALVRRRAMAAVTSAQRYLAEQDDGNVASNHRSPPQGATVAQSGDTGNIGHFLKRRKLPPISMTATTVKEAVMLWFERLVAAFFVISFVLYPTVMKYSGQLLLCKTIDHGILGQTSYLTVDMSIECSGWKFTAFRVVAITVLVIFGLGFPIGAMLLIKLFRRVSLNRRRTAQLFQFVVGGYEPHLWFWESVMMARKAAIAFANFGIADVSLRSYVMMWTIAAGFTLDVVFVPFRNKRQQIVDALAMAAIAVSLNLVQLYPFADEDTDSGVALTWAITCVALTVNLIAIAAVVWALSGTVREIIVSADMLPLWVVSRLSGGVEDEAAWKEQAAEARRVQHLSVTRSHPRLALLQRTIAAVPTPGSSIATVVRIHDTLSRVIPSVVDATPDLAPGDLQLLFQVERDLVELVIHILMQHHQVPTHQLRRTGRLYGKINGRSPAAEGGEDTSSRSCLKNARDGMNATRFGHMALQMQPLSPPDPRLETGLDLSQTLGSLLSSDGDRAGTDNNPPGDFAASDLSNSP